LITRFSVSFPDVVHPSVLHVLLAIAYPLGFIFVIIGKSELFTEHTTLAVRLMGLLSCLVTSAQETISRIVIFALITSVIGIMGLHHSIVGSIEIFTATLTNTEIGWKDYLHLQTWATPGIIIGGVFFVAFIKFSRYRENETALT
jgi:formate/nitrite transporter FocA (FNT family)